MQLYMAYQKCVPVQHLFYCMYTTSVSVHSARLWRAPAEQLLHAEDLWPEHPCVATLDHIVILKDGYVHGTPMACTCAACLLYRSRCAISVGVHSARLWRAPAEQLLHAEDLRPEHLRIVHAIDGVMCSDSGSYSYFERWICAWHANGVHLCSMFVIPKWVHYQWWCA